MPLSPQSQALIAKLDALHERAAEGDLETIHLIKSLKTRALSGDEEARHAYNTLAVIHWKKQKGGDYDKAEAYYKRLLAKEPKAMAKLRVLLERVRSGDSESLTLFRVLKSIHGKLKSSAFSDGPGALKVGHYPFPERDRPGIIIGGSDDAFYDHRETNPMNQRGRLHRIHGFHDGVAVSGLPFPRIPRPPVFGGTSDPLTLDAAATSNLIALIARVRAMPPVTALTLQSSLSSFSNGGGSTVPKSSTFTTVAKPFTAAVSAVEPAICASARTAVARNSPVAPQLVAQCKALGFNIPFNSATWQAAQAPATDPKSLVVINRPVIANLGIAAPHMTDAQRAAALANQGICTSAASALKRGSPAAPSLVGQCTATRRANIMAGQYFVDGMTTDDAAYRVALTDAGNAVVNGNAALTAFRASSMATPSGAKARGFTMAMGVRAGKTDPNYLAFVRPGLSSDPELLGGFDFGMSMS